MTFKYILINQWFDSEIYIYRSYIIFVMFLIPNAFDNRTCLYTTRPLKGRKYLH